MVPENSCSAYSGHLERVYHVAACRVSLLELEQVLQSLLLDQVNLPTPWVSFHLMTCSSQKHLPTDSQFEFHNPAVYFSGKENVLIRTKDSSLEGRIVRPFPKRERTNWSLSKE